MARPAPAADDWRAQVAAIKLAERTAVAPRRAPISAATQLSGEFKQPTMQVLAVRPSGAGAKIFIGSMDDSWRTQIATIQAVHLGKTPVVLASVAPTPAGAVLVAAKRTTAPAASAGEIVYHIKGLRKYIDEFVDPCPVATNARESCANTFRYGNVALDKHISCQPYCLKDCSWLAEKLKNPPRQAIVTIRARRGDSIQTYHAKFIVAGISVTLRNNADFTRLTVGTKPRQSSDDWNSVPRTAVISTAVIHPDQKAAAESSFRMSEQHVNPATGRSEWMYMKTVDVPIDQAASSICNWLNRPASDQLSAEKRAFLVANKSRINGPVEDILQKGIVPNSVVVQMSLYVYEVERNQPAFSERSEIVDMAIAFPELKDGKWIPSIMKQTYVPAPNISPNTFGVMTTAGPFGPSSSSVNHILRNFATGKMEEYVDPFWEGGLLAIPPLLAPPPLHPSFELLERRANPDDPVPPML